MSDRHPSPPPTRGSTSPPTVGGDFFSVSPAHAGIDRSHRPRRCRRSCLPRPRGDRPRRRRGSRRRSPSPPPTRGSTKRRDSHRSTFAVSPAHAGIDPRPPHPSRAGPSLPRPRGDRPRRAGARRPGRASPPPTRGSTRRRRGVRRQGAVSPAHAGIDRRPRQRPGRRSGLPRPRGDRPDHVTLCYSGKESPPPTRGSTLRGRCSRTAPHVSPAHAGIDRGRWTGLRIVSRLPRPRGDRPAHYTAFAAAMGSPPPTRGSTRAGPVLRAGDRVSPAHAGIDRRRPR